MKIKNFSKFLIVIGCVALIAGCGKHEKAGTATGAVLGAAVAGKHSRGSGALVGGLIGNYFGRRADKKVEKKEQKEKVEELKAENRDLQAQLTKWCENCNQQVRIRGAKSCPGCGGKLIQEKFCDRCSTVFSPGCGFRYCPYCSKRVELASR
jgi:hypothetical protein